MARASYLLVCGLLVTAGACSTGRAAYGVDGAHLSRTGQDRTPHSAQQATAKLTVLPAPIGQLSSGSSNYTPAIATFRPVNPKHKVVVERLSGSKWTIAASGVQSAAGTFDTELSAKSATGAPWTYRALTWLKTGGVPVVSSNVASASWPTSLSDNFDGTALNASRWQSRQVGLRAGKRMCGVVTPDNATVAGGVAQLSITRLGPSTTKCPHGQYDNAMFGTDHSYSFTYGYAAARVRFESGAGQHGGFWLQANPPLNAIAGQPAANGAEVDIAEYFGAQRADGGLGNFVHWAGKGANGQAVLDTVGGERTGSTRLNGGHDWSAGYHVYSVQWTPTSYVFRVDGHVTFSTTSGVSHHPEFLVLSLLTSDWELPGLNRLALPSKMSVDWVRVWQG